MNVWLCQQTEGYARERADSVVAGSTLEVKSNKYRRATLERVRSGDVVVHSCGTRRRGGPPGIVAVSVAQESARRFPPFDELPSIRDASYSAGLYFKTRYFDLNPVVDNRIFRDRLHQSGLSFDFLDLNGRPKAQGYLFPFCIQGLEIVRSCYSGDWPLDRIEEQIPVELDGDGSDSIESFWEGGQQGVVRSVRNKALRSVALRKYGYRCYCCGFEFREFYGEIARGRAIVHHLETFSGLDDGRRVATVDDVRVVCANCHYVIHFSKQPRDVDDLKRSIAREWTAWSQRGLSRKQTSR